ncbi:hypothetical protein [Agromyces sp. NPDC058064]|uniref:hypothetical protein n=1 Tax=Agromyces sp. NPDC058064 TaxID=3346322 RepID=UPI0036D8A18B
MTRRTLPRALTATTGLALLLLSGCTATPAEPTASEPAPSAAGEPSAEATPAPTAPTPSTVTCETVLTPDAYAELEADGLTPRDATAHTPFMGDLLDAGALGCRWAKDQSDIAFWVARLPVDGETWPAWETALTAAGFTQGDDPVPDAYLGPVEPGSGIAPVVVRTDDAITYVSAPDFAVWIAPAG